MKDIMKPKAINDKWYIEVYTKEFGNVLLLEKGKLKAREFSTKEETIDYIKKGINETYKEVNLKE